MLIKARDDLFNEIKELQKKVVDLNIEKDDLLNFIKLQRDGLNNTELVVQEKQQKVYLLERDIQSILFEKNKQEELAFESIIDKEKKILSLDNQISKKQIELKSISKVNIKDNSKELIKINKEIELQIKKLSDINDEIKNKEIELKELENKKEVIKGKEMILDKQEDNLHNFDNKLRLKDKRLKETRKTLVIKK